MELYQLYAISEFNNIVYIGYTKQSKGYKKRFEEHLNCKNDGTLLHSKINKEDFSVKLLIHDIPKDKIDFYEILWIKKFQTHYKYGHGYNMTIGGEGVIGHQHSKEALKKMSYKIKLYWEDLRNNCPDVYAKECKRRSDSLKGVPKSPEHRLKLSLSRKGKYTKEKNAFYGKHHSEKTRKKLSDLNNKPILMLDKNSEDIIREFKSLKDAQEWCVLNHLTTNKSCGSRISKICLGIDKTAYGYKWRYK